MWAQVDGEHVAGAEAAKRATPPRIFELCTDERRYGPVRVQAPHLTRSEDGQGPEVGSRSTTRRSSGRTHPQAAGTEYFSLDVEDVPAAGLRPGVLAEPRPQERVQRDTVEHIVDLVRVAPMVQILDAPVPQIVEQLPDILRFFDTLIPDPEQVTEVPKILPEDVPHAHRGARYAAGESWLRFCRRCCPNPWVEDSSGANRAVRRHSSLWRWWRAAGEVLVVLARGGTPPGQGGIEILARGVVDVFRSRSSCSSSPSRTCSSPRFSSLDRVVDIPVVPQKGDSTVQSLNKVVDAVVYDICPWSRQCCSCVHRQGRRHPCFRLQKWRCLRFSHRQSSMTIPRRKGCFFGAFCAIFWTLPRG